MWFLCALTAQLFGLGGVELKGVLLQYASEVGHFLRDMSSYIVKQCSELKRNLLIYYPY